MLLIRYILVFAVSVGLYGGAALANAPVEVGAELPHTLELLDKNAQSQSFESIKGEKGAVIYFVRSLDWCPYCQVQMLDVRDYGPDIEAAGYNVVAISYDSPEKLKTFADRYRFNYTLLSDGDSEVIKAFGILDETKEPGTPYYGIPHPTIYVVNADGVIKAALPAETYKRRPASDVIFEAIK